MNVGAIFAMTWMVFLIIMSISYAFYLYLNKPLPEEEELTYDVEVGNSFYEVV